MSEQKHFIIIARRWFQKLYGNTYHSVEVYLNGELLEREPFTYGYGSHYTQTALKILQKHGHGQEENHLWQYGELVKKSGSFLVTCNDVSRKKDL